MSNNSEHVRPVRLRGGDRVQTNWSSLDGQRKFYQSRGKRALDIILAAGLLIALSPLLLAIAVLVARDGASPIYAHTRVGQRGRPFGCLKFRSMVPNAKQVLEELIANDPSAAEEWRQNQKLVNDPRVTPIGHVLRKFSLDELPQLWCVLVGDMSIVGPRPVTEAELERFGHSAGFVLSIRPGMTGLWQVSGRGLGVSYSDRVQMDVAYVRSMNLASDASIILATAAVVLRGTGT